ncbi:MAG TPA: SRPBCC family protein [Rhodopila sp.]|jgi:hypothetical protein|nr:SRPBCC family protein [Rhodopila sp.]
MGTIITETMLNSSADAAWAMLRDVGAGDRAFPGVLVASEAEGDIRTVTFASGNVVRERIVSIDEARRRIAYAVIEGRFQHHSASMQIVPHEAENCRFVWTTDFLPDEAGALLTDLIDQGSEAFKHVMEGA